MFTSLMSNSRSNDKKANWLVKVIFFRLFCCQRRNPNDKAGCSDKAREYRFPSADLRAFGSGRTKPHRTLTRALRFVRRARCCEYPQSLRARNVVLIFKAPAVVTLASMRTQKLVAQITVTVLDVDEVKTKFVRKSRGVLKVGNNAANFAIR